jgi:effector-binding domain-containing protein
MEESQIMSRKAFFGLSLPAVGVVALLAAADASAITAKSTTSTYFLFRQNFGAYSKVDKPLKKVKAFVESQGLSGPLIGIYYDVTQRTAPSMQRADLGVVISEEKAMAMLKEIHSDVNEEDWGKLMEDLETSRGAIFQDTFFIKKVPGRLVASAKVNKPFLKFHSVYEKIQEWTWANGFFIVGPVIEIYHSPVHRDKVVSAEVQIVIERSGVPDRR